jgi:hypothetical protein
VLPSYTYTFPSENSGFTELRIAEVDKSCGSALGGDTLWMRCAAKVRKGRATCEGVRTHTHSDHIRVTFTEPSSGWTADGQFTAADVHEQILIIFRTPAYHTTNITEKKVVEMRLFRTSDEIWSAPIEFVYLPVDEGWIVGCMIQY